MTEAQSESQVEIHNEGEMGEDATLDMVAVLAIVTLVVAGAVFWVAGV